MIAPRPPPNCPYFESHENENVISDGVYFWVWFLDQETGQQEKSWRRLDSFESEPWSWWRDVIAGLAYAAWMEARDHPPLECQHERDSSGYDFWQQHCQDRAEEWLAWRDGVGKP